MHEALDEASIPILVQEPEAYLGVVHEWMRAGIGEDELKKLSAVIQTSNISLEIFDLLMAYMWGDCQATV